MAKDTLIYQKGTTPEKSFHQPTMNTAGDVTFPLSVTSSSTLLMEEDTAERLIEILPEGASLWGSRKPN